jgi:uncharacterized cupin superfamily protein
MPENSPHREYRYDDFVDIPRRRAVFPDFLHCCRPQMSALPRIVILDGFLQGESANPSPENILAGIPCARVANQYADPSGQFFCGLWTSSIGKWRVRYSEHEFCVILEGRVHIESICGQRHEARAGDAFVVPAGFEGSWEVIEACRKWYAIFEPKS